jgi:hypothetical protein
MASKRVPRDVSLSGYDLTRTVDCQRAHIALVRAGHGVQAAARIIGLAPTAITNWRANVPGFAERLDAAKRDAVALDRRVVRALGLLAKGVGLSEASIRAGGGKSWLYNLRRSHPEIDAEVQRLVHPTRRASGRRDGTDPVDLTDIARRVAARVASGMCIADAARAEGVPPASVRGWRARRPLLYEMVRSALGPRSRSIRRAQAAQAREARRRAARRERAA